MYQFAVDNVKDVSLYRNVEGQSLEDDHKQYVFKEVRFNMSRLVYVDLRAHKLTTIFHALLISDMYFFNQHMGHNIPNNVPRFILQHLHKHRTIIKW